MEYDNTLKVETPEIKKLLFDLNLCTKVYCTEEEQQQFKTIRKAKEKLPEGVIYINSGAENGFYRIKTASMTEPVLQKYMLLLQTKYISTIKNCVLFFTVLMIIGLIGVLILSVR